MVLPALSATGVVKGLSPWAIMVLATCLSADMALIGTDSGILMVGAGGWAFITPLHTLYYDLSSTALAVVVAVLVGGIETLGFIGRHLQPSGPSVGSRRCRTAISTRSGSTSSDCFCSPG